GSTRGFSKNAGLFAITTGRTETSGSPRSPSPSAERRIQAEPASSPHPTGQHERRSTMIIHPEDRLIVARQQQELLRSEAGPLVPALIVRLIGAARRATEGGAAALAAGPGTRLRGSGVRR